jgi:hypothetical protein
MFRIDVAKVEMDIAYVAYTRLLQASVLFVFSDVCCKCFYLDVTYVSHICLQVFLSGCCTCFAMAFQVFSQVFQTHVSCVSSFFRCMLQKFYLDVSTVHRVLSMLQCDSPTTTICCCCWGVVHACGKQRGGALRGCERSPPNAGVRLNIRALVLPNMEPYTFLNSH